MFCPKCGNKAIDGTKFCRSCGQDLEVVSGALTGALTLPNQGKKKKKNKDDDEHSNDPDKLWSSFITNGLSGLAFIVVAIFLTVTGISGGHVWGFWLLIPGAGMLGSGIASYLKAKRIEQRLASGQASNAFGLPTANLQDAPFNQLNQPLSQTDLPPARQTFADIYESPKTGELVLPPNSVTENTTRHLSHESENPTAMFQSPPNRD